MAGIAGFNSGDLLKFKQQEEQEPEFVLDSADVTPEPDPVITSPDVNIDVQQPEPETSSYVQNFNQQASLRAQELEQQQADMQRESAEYEAETAEYDTAVKPEEVQPKPAAPEPVGKLKLLYEHADKVRAEQEKREALLKEDL